MSRRPSNEELEKAVEAAFKEAGMAEVYAIPASRLATAAICHYVMGCRMTFSKNFEKAYRDRAIYEMSRTGITGEIAPMENLSARQIRNIVRTQRAKKGA